MICSTWMKSASKTGPNCATGRSANLTFPAPVLYYGAIVLIPVVILLLMFLLAHRR